jgi:hypothetical protein
MCCEREIKNWKSARLIRERLLKSDLYRRFESYAGAISHVESQISYGYW